MANTLLTTDGITNYTLPLWTTNTLFLHTANRDVEVEWDRSAYKFGDTLRIRRRNRAVIEDGPTGVANLQSIQEEFESLTINHWYKHRFEFDLKDLTLKVDKFYDRYIKPVVTTMAVRQDTDVAESAEFDLSYFVGTPGTPLNTYKSLSDITARMQELGMEHENEKYLAVTPNDAATMRASLSNYFNNMLNSRIIDQAKLGRIDTLDIVTSTGLKRHIAGNPGPGKITVSVATGSGNILQMTGFTASTLVAKKGDLFSVANTRAINPLRQKETSFEMQFVVTADVTSDGLGNAAVPFLAAGGELISDALNANRNISNAMQIGDEVTFVGDHNVNICYIPRALSLVAPPIQMLKGLDTSVASLPDMNASMRLTADGDIVNGLNSYRTDLLSGNKWHAPYAMRVLS